MLIATESVHKIIIDDDRVKFEILATDLPKGVIINRLLEKITTKYFMIIKEGDELDPNALGLFSIALNKNTSLIYCDEDSVSHNKGHHDPFLKPNYSPNLLYSVDYISYGSVFLTSMVKAIGGVDESLQANYLYDLTLKLRDRLDCGVVHLPYVLYHHRSLDDENSATEFCKIAAHYSAAKVEKMKIENGRLYNKVAASKLNASPKISIIIPVKDKIALLKSCIKSIKKSSYNNYEIIVIDNSSQELASKSYFKQLKAEGIAVFPYNKPYNNSAINNFAANKAKGEALCFLNNDTEVLSKQWLEEMLFWLENPGVGMVGAKLYYPADNRLQHGGMHCVRNPYNKGFYITHGYLNVPKNEAGYLNEMLIPHEVSSVTGACIMMTKALFLKIGGFDEKNTPTTYSDVDLCFKVREQGYSVMWTPHAELIHIESASEGIVQKRLDSKAHDYITKRWQHYFACDVHLNANLSFLYGRYPVLTKN